MSKRQFEEDMALQTFKEILKAVMFLHSKKLIHRDIKPENVLLDEVGRIKLCDFGFCAPIETNERRVTFCGTQQYLPPEIMLSEDQTEKVDIWCMGVLLFELMHKRVPFENKNMKIYLEKITKKQVAFNPRCSWQIRKLISSCLELNPKDRPTAAQLLNDPLLNDPKSNNRANSVIPGERSNRGGGIKMMGNWLDQKNQTINKITQLESKTPDFNKPDKRLNAKEIEEPFRDSSPKFKRNCSPIIPSQNTRDTRYQGRAQTPNMQTSLPLYQTRIYGIESTPVSANPSFKSIPNDFGFKQVNSSTNFGDYIMSNAMISIPNESSYLKTSVSNGYTEFTMNNGMTSVPHDSGYKQVSTSTNFSEMAMNNVKMSLSTTNSAFANQLQIETQDNQFNYNKKPQQDIVFKDFNSLFTKEKEPNRMQKSNNNFEIKRALTPKPDYQYQTKQSYQLYSPTNAPSNTFFPTTVKSQTGSSGIIMNPRGNRSPLPTMSENYASVQSPSVYVHQPYTPSYKNSPTRNINILPIVDTTKKPEGMHFYYQPVSLNGEARSNVLYKQSLDRYVDSSHSPNKKSK